MATTGNGSSYTFSGSEGGTPLAINPPFPVTYQVTETTPVSSDVGFDTAVTGDCSGTITTGQDLTCTITNTATLLTSTLTVNKHVDCNFTSLVACPTANQFIINATTGNGSSYTFSGSEGGTPLAINPPFPVTYQVTETSPTQGFVVATISVGNSPRGIAFNPNNGNLYVANALDGTVTVINGTTNTVVATIPVGVNPIDIAFNPNNGNLYVTNFVDNTVTVINGATNTVVGTPIPVGLTPNDIAFNPNNGNLYVTNSFDGTVSVINGTTNTVVATIPVGVFPRDIAFNPNNGNLYVTNSGTSNTVTVIDGATNTVVGTPIQVGRGPGGIAFNPNNGNLYVTNNFDRTVSVIAPLTTTYSNGCNGAIDNGGQTAPCTVTNAYGRP
jgi:YVTN family beta-propeller protein